MGYVTGTGKYLVMGLLFNPVNLYIYGGTLLWFSDVLDLVGSDSINEFAWNYVLVEFGVPWPIEDAIMQLFVGAAVATVSWLVGSLAYARSRGWR